ncbi:DNA polymerase III subunit alpha [bacterium]|nr:MAG: DNA polymerase III subunit alpha [bacterium]
MLPQNLEGYKNLMRLVTISHLEGYYYKPRIDKEVLSQFSAGLIGLSACLRGEISVQLKTKNFAGAKASALEYQKIFAPGNFYLEVQRNSKDPIQETVNQDLVKLGRETGIPIVATADAHYLRKEDADAQDILVCVGTGRTVDETDRLDMREMELDLKTAEEMNAIFSDLPEAVSNTVKIADSVNLEIPLQERHFPSFAVPDGTTAENYLEKLCYEGIARRHDIAPTQTREEIKKNLPEEVRNRLEYELSIIIDKGYSTYFLVVADFANWARNRGIIITTRGSAAGSLVAYALNITAMNPLQYKLPFERFLNPSRPTPPDIDMDFADNRRDEVLQYVSEKYGKDHVAQIVTFGTMMARAAIRDVGRALGIPYFKCDRIAKMIPFGKQGFHMTIDKALTLAPELKEAYQKDAETKNLIDLARKVEGCARHASVHAAGVVISPTKLSDYTPLQMDTDNKNVITQYDMHSVEDAGLIKMDFLGIRNLSILGNSVEIVRGTRGLDIDLQNIPLNDKKTFDLLASGRTIGVFQLGGSGMTKYLVDLKPSNIFDIMAMISLYRPGPSNQFRNLSNENTIRKRSPTWIRA